MSEYNITYEVVQDHDGYFRVKNITKKRPYRFSTSTGDHFGKTTDLTKLLNALKSGADKLTNEAKTDLETYVKTVEGKLSSVNALTSSLSQSTDKTYKAVTSSEIVSSIYYGLNHYDKLMAFREVTNINGNTVYYLKETISENVYNNLSPLVKNLFKSSQVTTQTEDDD